MRPEVLESKWFRPLCYSGQLKFLAVPYRIAHHSQWAKACIEGGLVLDRARLTLMREGQLNAIKDDGTYADLIRLVACDFEVVR